MEIETEILSHPNILEVAVVGVSDEVTGERVIAIVVAREDISLPEFTASIKAFLKDKLSYYKQPRQYFLVKALPRNHMGKLNKKTIVNELGIKF